MTSKTATASGDQTRIMQQVLEYIPFAVALGLTVLEADRGVARVALPYDDKLASMGAGSVIAGGAIFALLDTAAGMALGVALQGFRPMATMSLHVEYLGAATPGKTVLGEMRCMRLGREVAFLRGSAWHEGEDQKIALGSSTFTMKATTAAERAAFRALSQEGGI